MNVQVGLLLPPSHSEPQSEIYHLRHFALLLMFIFMVYMLSDMNLILCGAHHPRGSRGRVNTKCSFGGIMSARRLKESFGACV